MALAIMFTPRSMNANQYDEIIRRLAAAGAGAPRGRLDHICFGTGSNLRVLDVWESQEAVNKFFQELGSALQEAGIPATQPQFWPVHNMLSGPEHYL